jgi:hypothetical protein
LAALTPIGFALLVAPISALAATDRFLFVRDVGYTYGSSAAVLTADQIGNFEPFNSGTLRMELWALTAPYTGAAASGVKLAQYVVGQLATGLVLSDVNSGTVPFIAPPQGAWRIVLFLTEYTAAPYNDGYSVTDWRNFTDPVVIGPAMAPMAGVWWNPDESGSGYALDYENGVLLVQVYSYTPDGPPQWYLASGQMNGNVFTGTLDKYTGGQCISCTYKGRPVYADNDGTMTIAFTSPTTANVALPGGRTTQIRRYFGP